MKMIIVFAILGSVVYAAPERRFTTAVSRQSVIKPVASQRRAVNPDEVVLVKETSSDNIGLDGYKFAYELSDGTTREESAQVETRGDEDAVLRVRGSFSWVNPKDGQTYTVTYIADENGFQPQGAHLPNA